MKLTPVTFWFFVIAWILIITIIIFPNLGILLGFISGTVACILLIGLPALVFLLGLISCVLNFVDYCKNWEKREAIARRESRKRDQLRLQKQQEIQNWRKDRERELDGTRRLIDELCLEDTDEHRKICDDLRYSSVIISGLICGCSGGVK